MTIQPEQVPEKVVIGVLGRFHHGGFVEPHFLLFTHAPFEALQGAFIEHIYYLQKSVTQCSLVMK